MKKVLGKIVGVLMVVGIVLEVILIAFILVMRLSDETPSLFGYNIFVVSTGSMEPELGVGDVIVCRSYDGGELNKGDVVTYLGKEGEMRGKLITHKIVSVSGEGEDRVIVTQGVANPVADPAIAPSDVKAVFVYRTVLIGPIYKVITNIWGFIFLIVLPILAVIASEIVNLVKEWKHSKEEQSDEP